MNKKLTNQNKHLVPAFYNWLSENDPKVFVHVSMSVPGVVLNPYPRQEAFKSLVVGEKDGKTITTDTIALNTNPMAVSNFMTMEDGFSFSCRMSGTVTMVFVPYEAVFALSCPDTGIEQNFYVEVSVEEVAKQTGITQKQIPTSERKRGHLKLVSSN